MPIGDVLLNVPLPAVIDHVPVVAPPPIVAPVNVIGEGVPDWQTVTGIPAFTVAAGFTVIVKLTGGPGQFTTGFPAVCTGVTVIVAVTGVLPLFTATKDAILPVPLAASPIEGALFVQVKEVTLVPLKFTGVVLAPLHTVWLGGVFTIDGMGFTVKVAGSV